MILLFLHFKPSTVSYALAHSQADYDHFNREWEIWTGNSATNSGHTLIITDQRLLLLGGSFYFIFIFPNKHPKNVISS